MSHNLTDFCEEATVKNTSKTFTYRAQRGSYIQYD
jgi:hypothetical protein